MTETEEHKDDKLEKGQIQEAVRAPTGGTWASTPRGLWETHQYYGDFAFVSYVPSPQKSWYPGMWPSLWFQVVFASVPAESQSTAEAREEQVVQVSGTALRSANISHSDHSRGEETCSLQLVCGYVHTYIHI